MGTKLVSYYTSHRPYQHRFHRIQAPIGCILYTPTINMLVYLDKGCLAITIQAPPLSFPTQPKLAEHE